MRQSRRAATPDARNTDAPTQLIDGSLRCVPISVRDGGAFPLCRMFVTPRNDDTFPLRPVRTKRRGATCDVRNTAAPAPSRTVHCRMFPSCRASVATRDDAMRFHCGSSHCALPGTGRHEWRPYGALPHVPLCRMFVTPRNNDTFPLRRFAPNVGVPPRTPGRPPHPRHHGRFTAARFRCAARPLRRGTTRCVPIAAVHIVPWRAPGVMNGAPTVHCRTFHCAACSLRHGTTTRFLCARFAPNAGPPPRTPGRPPHPRHHGRFTAACPR